MKNLLILLLLATSLFAEKVALAKNIKGTVEIKDAENITQIKNGDWLYEQMLVMTKDDSEVHLVFIDNSKLVLGPNSILLLTKYLFNGEQNEYDAELQLNKGVASFESGEIGTLSPENFTFKTPESTIAIRGTKFIVKVQ